MTLSFIKSALMGFALTSFIGHSSLSFAEPEVLGKLEIQGLKFFQTSQHKEAHEFYGSVAIEPELFHAIDNNSEIKAKLFYRHDAQSKSRTHGDVRELMYYYFEDDWEIHAGISKVFWGVTESRHLVDTINQIDNIEILDDEQRLGQAMLQAKLIKDWGTLDLFVLPHFREVNFGKADMRPYLGYEISSALYQNKAKQHHLDFAARWSKTLGNADIGLSYFNGTQRTPLLNPVLVNGSVQLQPVYVQTQNLGLDLQYIYKDWLLKLEAVYRNSHEYNAINGFKNKSSKAFVGGFEYTFYGINEQYHDLGLIGEYLFDQWQALTPFQRDWMTGLRWTWNDAPSTEFLLGHILDLDDGTQIWQLEASRRLNESFKASMTARVATHVDNQNSFAAQLKNQDQISLKLDYFF